MAIFSFAFCRVTTTLGTLLTSWPKAPWPRQWPTSGRWSGNRVAWSLSCSPGYKTTAINCATDIGQRKDQSNTISSRWVLNGFAMQILHVNKSKNCAFFVHNYVWRHLGIWKDKSSGFIFCNSNTRLISLKFLNFGEFYFLLHSRSVIRLSVNGLNQLNTYFPQDFN